MPVAFVGTARQRALASAGWQPAKSADAPPCGRAAESPGTVAFSSHLLVWLVAALSIAALVLRPFGAREWIGPAAGAALLVVAGVLPWGAALRAVGEGLDVYLFIAGMMLISELARREGLFDHLAAVAVRVGGGSPRRLLVLVYGIGVVVTAFMSNDATAVVLTPAVSAAARKAGLRPLPYLFACALVANAASFVLPMSNPANLLVFDGQLPALGDWLRQLGLPALGSVLATFAVLRWRMRADLRGGYAVPPAPHALGRTGRYAAWGVGATAVALVAASALGQDLGTVTFAVATLAVAAVLAAKRESPIHVLRHVAWSVLVLVAALFILVAAVERTGLLATLTQHLADGRAASAGSLWTAAGVTALACNLLNNLPAGLVAASTVSALHASTPLRDAVAIGIDLGPNLSITGALSNVLWLVAIRREQHEVGALRFLAIGLLAMPAALACALALLQLSTAI